MEPASVAMAKAQGHRNNARIANGLAVVVLVAGVVLLYRAEYRSYVACIYTLLVLKHVESLFLRWQEKELLKMIDVLLGAVPTNKKGG